MLGPLKTGVENAGLPPTATVRHVGQIARRTLNDNACSRTPAPPWNPSYVWPPLCIKSFVILDATRASSCGPRRMKPRSGSGRRSERSIGMVAPAVRPAPGARPAFGSRLVFGAVGFPKREPLSGVPVPGEGGRRLPAVT